MNRIELIGAAYTVKPATNTEEYLSELLMHVWALEILLKKSTTSRTINTMIEDIRKLAEKTAEQQGVDLDDLTKVILQ